MAMSVFLSTVTYAQYMGDQHKINTSLTKDICWNKINEWVVDGFHRYHTVVDYEDKDFGWIVVKGRYNPELDGMISTLYNQLTPIIEFVLEFKCGDKSCTIVFREFYYTFNLGKTIVVDINNVEIIKSSTAELKAINRAGGQFAYNNELKQDLGEKALLLTDIQTKANDRTLKKKGRKLNQKLYDLHSVEFRVLAKAYNDMKLFAPHILREISVYLQ